MHRTYEHSTKSRLSFSGRPHAPVNMADNMEEVNAGGKKCRKWHVCCTVLHYISYPKFSQILEVLRDFHHLFGSRNSPTTGVLHTICHVYRGMWPIREAKPYLSVVPCSNALCMIVKQAYYSQYNQRTLTVWSASSRTVLMLNFLWQKLKRSSKLGPRSSMTSTL